MACSTHPTHTEGCPHCFQVRFGLPAHLHPSRRARAAPAPAASQAAPVASKPAKARVKINRQHLELPCVYLGDATGEKKVCEGCGTHPLVGINRCALHGECTVQRSLTNGLKRWPYCMTCQDYDPHGPAFLFTGGLGDVLALESFFPERVRAALSGLTLACPAAPAVADLFGALPNYPRLKGCTILPTGSAVYYEKAGVEKAHGKVMAEDWSIATRFPTLRGEDYTGSSFLAHRLCQSRSIGQPYVVVVPHSRWGRWADRSFDAADWQACLDYLAEYELLGVILHEGPEVVEPHPRLLDLTNQTSVTEAVEILKGAEGYLGIDTWLSVLAAKLFAPGRLAVKSVWGHCYEWQHLYFAPCREFPFLKRSLAQCLTGRSWAK
jgi:hypothetical protein